MNITVKLVILVETRRVVEIVEMTCILILVLILYILRLNVIIFLKPVNTVKKPIHKTSRKNI
jgi:hypothetical protein